MAKSFAHTQTDASSFHLMRLTEQLAEQHRELSFRERRSAMPIIAS